MESTYKYRDLFGMITCYQMVKTAREGRVRKAEARRADRSPIGQLSWSYTQKSSKACGGGLCYATDLDLGPLMTFMAVAIIDATSATLAGSSTVLVSLANSPKRSM